MRGKQPQPDPRVEAPKMASLSVAWGVVAGVAYLGLIGRAVTFLTTVTPWSGVTIDQGLVTVLTASSKQSAFHFSGVTQTAAQIAVVALPFAILAIIALGIAARVRPSMVVFGGLLIVASLIGLAGTLVIFVAQVATRNVATEFLVALATIVIVAILVRLQKVIRRFYNRAPAFSTLLLTAATLFYLIFSDGVSFSSIIITQLDIWLAIVAFAIAFYAALRLARHGTRINRMAPPARQPQYARR